MAEKEKPNISGRDSGAIDPRREIIYSPVVISHITENISDLFRTRLKGKESIQIHYTSQMNSKPHLGTTMSLMTAFALGNHLSIDYNIPTKLNFNVLENAPTEQKVVNDLTYTKMYHDIYRGGTPVSEIYINSFIGLY